MTQAEQKKQFEAAETRCAELMKQCYWERHYVTDDRYNYTGFLSMIKLGSLKPAWWSPLCGDGRLGEADLRINGHVEYVMLPLLPTLVKTGKVDPRARGPVSNIPQHMALKVKRVTRQHAEGTVESWFCYENNLIVPFTVTAAPILCFHEPLTYFDDLKPSTPERFEKAVSLVLDFVRNTQAMFPEEVKV